MKKKKLLLGLTLAVFGMAALASCNGKTSKKSTHTQSTIEKSETSKSEESKQSSIESNTNEESKNTSTETVISSETKDESTTNTQGDLESSSVVESTSSETTAQESQASQTSTSEQESTSESTAQESSSESTQEQSSTSEQESSSESTQESSSESTSETVEQVTVQFMVDGNLYDTKTIDSNTKVTKPQTDPTKTGMNFLYWTYKGLEFDFSSNVKENITLVASFTPASQANTYSYGFGDGYTPWTYLAETAGTKVVSDKTVLASTVTIDAFTFQGNDKSRVDNENTYNTQKATVTIVMKTAGTIYLEGTWGSSDKTGKVYLKNSSGTALYTSDTYSGTATVINFSKEVEAGTYTITSDQTIKITKLFYVRDYQEATVTFSTEFGSVNPRTLETGDKLGELPELYEDGYVFKGWKLPNGEYATANTVITGDTVLTADFEVYDVNNYVTIYFSAPNYTGTLNPVTIEKGSTYTPEALTLEGYKFNGWYEDDEFKYAHLNTSPVNDDLYLYGQFIKEYTVTYKDINGNVITTETVLEDESVTKAPNPETIYGKKFDGWTLNGVLFDLETNITADIILVASYSDIAVTDKISIMASGSSFESLYAEFMPFENADSYNAYVKLSSGTETKLDTQLIRKYKSGTDNYYRVDAVGLKAGSYTLRIVPVISGSEATAAQESVALNVIAHDRTGFGFVNGTSSGAYNEDGTLRQNAQVLYITETTKDTVSMDVVTSSKGATTNGVGLQNILNLYKKGYDSRPLDIRIIGQIKDLAVMEGGDVVISGSGSTSRVSCGITFEGIGKDATCDGWGLRIKNASNVEVRNLGFMNCNSSEGDNCGLQQDNDHVWVHNCDFFYGDAGSDADQAKGDGALDTKNSTYITHSYNHFYDSGKCNLQGMKTESTSNYITYHHNWYDHSDSRHPRIRTCTVHIYNNYFDGNAKYGVGVTLGASAFVENNYFRSTATMKPMLISMQGTDIDGDDGTFSSEDGGIIKAYGNTFDGTVRFVPYSSTNSVEFDAYVASSRDEVIPSTVVCKKGGTSYNNFDTASTMYQYTVETAEQAKNTVMQYAGRLQGGDFSWSFNNATEDSNYEVITALKQALTKYATNLVSVQGIEGNQGGSGEIIVDTSVDDVIALITALPDPSAVVEADRAQIMAAKTAYEALSDSDKELVTNASKLTNCINALPAQTSFTIDYTTYPVTTGTNNVTIYNENDIVITCTKVSGQDSTRGIKLDSSKSITITNNSNVTKTFVLTVIGNGGNKSFTVDGTTTTFGTTATTITFTVAAGASKTMSTSTGGAFITTVVVS